MRNSCYHEVISLEDYLELEKANETLFGTNHYRVRNLSIAYAFRNTFGAPPPDKWGGKDGTVDKLLKMFNIPRKKRRAVYRILDEAWECIQSGTVFTDTWRQRGGRSSIIQKGDLEEHIIAELLEAGLGFRHTLEMVNQSRIDRGLTNIGISALVNTFRRMNPVITKIRQRTQANDNNVEWKKARLNQCKQYMIMLGKISMA